MRPMHLDESPAGHATLLAARQALIQEQTSAGHWEGRLSSSALSTATAVVTLALSLREPPSDSFGDGDRVQRGTGWLLDHQNEDGGWGDTDRSFSNISTTALGWAALAFAARSELVATAECRAEAWLTNAAGGVAPSALAKSIEARYGKDRTFSVPILTMCALAGRMGERDPHGARGLGLGALRSRAASPRRRRDRPGVDRSLASLLRKSRRAREVRLAPVAAGVDGARTEFLTLRSESVIRGATAMPWRPEHFRVGRSRLPSFPSRPHDLSRQCPARRTHVRCGIPHSAAAFG